MKNLLKFTLLIGIFFLTVSDLFSQQGPLYSQYMINKFLINPAVAGGNGYTDLNMIARQQYVGFENAPRTFALTAQSRILNESHIMRRLRIRKNANQGSIFTNVGIGGNIFSDRNGLVTKTGLSFSYAYHINFNNRYQLSMGLSLSALQYKLDDSEALLIDTDDPVLMGNKKNFWVPDATFGVYFTDNRSYIGVTITDLLGSGIKLGNDPIAENFSSLRNFNIMVGTDINLSDDFRLEPSSLIRINSLESSVDFTTQLYYQDSYWLGVSYRTNKTLIAMIGLNVDIFRLAYAYDTSFGPIKSYSSGSHEIILGVRFGDNSVNRFRWLRKDSMEYDM